MSSANESSANASTKPNAEGSQRKVAFADGEAPSSPEESELYQEPPAKGSKTPHVRTSDLPGSPQQTGAKLPASPSVESVQVQPPIPDPPPKSTPNIRKAPVFGSQYASATTSSSFSRNVVSSPPVFRLPDHLRRGQKSVRRSQHQSMIRECFASPSPGTNLAYMSPWTPAQTVQPIVPTSDYTPAPDPSDPAEVTADQDIPITDTWQFSSTLRIKSNMDYQTPYGTRIQFPSFAAESLLFFSSAEDGEIVLADLLHLTASGEITGEWLHSLISYPPLLRSVVRVAELVTPVDGVLNPNSPCAQVLDFLLEKNPVGNIMHAICSPLVDGCVALRHIVRKSRASSAFVPPSPSPGYTNPQQGVLIPYILDHACDIISKSGADSVASIHAFRLVEATLPKIHTLDDMQQAPLRWVAQSITHILKNKDMRRRGERPGVDAARRVAALQLVSAILRSYKRLLERVEAESEAPEMPEEEWLLQDLAISDVVQYLEDDDADPMVRCMALRVIHDFASVDLDEVPGWERLEDVANTCVELLLWKTDWQHEKEKQAKLLDIVGFCPHEEAYHILSFAPSDLVVRLVSRALATEDKLSVLEPLLSLIVDHSKLKDRYWPFMLSILIHSGCLSFFHAILTQGGCSEEDDTDVRTTCRSKADACIGLTRCFEQMRAKDMRAVPADVCLTLEKLEQDDAMTTILRHRARDALTALHENVMPSFELSLSPRLSVLSRTLTDSSPRSPQPDSNLSISSSVTSP